MDFGCYNPETGQDDLCNDPFNRMNLTPEQEEELQIAIDHLQETCLGNALIDSVEEVNVAIGDLTSGVAAQYNATSNTIEFPIDNVGNALGEELFHAYQQQLYGTLGDISLPSTGHVGGSNIKFEEKAYSLLRDLITQHAH